MTVTPVRYLRTQFVSHHHHHHRLREEEEEDNTEDEEEGENNVPAQQEQEKEEIIDNLEGVHSQGRFARGEIVRQTVATGKLLGQDQDLFGPRLLI